MTIRTHFEAGTDNQRIVGFEVEPRSVAYYKDTAYDPENKQEKHYLKEKEPILFTYSVTTINDGTTLWANRMDHFYKIGNHNVHMADILFCIGLIALLGAVVAGLVEFTVRKDVKTMGQLISSMRSLKRDKLNYTKNSLINSN